MAYIDQDNSRENTFSGVIAITLVGAVGYALVSGLALSIVREPPGIIPGTSYKGPPPPPPHPSPRAHKTMPNARPTDTPSVPPIQPRIDPITIDLGNTPTVVGLGGDGQAPSFPPLPPQPTIDHTARAMPRGNPGDWVTPDYYPPSAVRAGLEGRTVFRLDVGINGRATGCTIVTSSGADELDRAACRVLINKARFTPAKNSGGDPVVSTYSGGVTWKLPAE